MEDFFLDTNCFSKLRNETIEYLYSIANRIFITDKVLEEIKEGYKQAIENNSNLSRYQLILKNENEVNERIKIITFDYCEKEQLDIDFSNNIVNIKKDPIFCSSYCHWFIHVINPSIITHPFRHKYNLLLYEMKEKGTSDELSRRIGELVDKEIKSYEQYYSEIKTKDEIEYKTKLIKNSRKKRRKEFAEGNVKSTDTQLLLTSILYSIYTGRPTTLLSSDGDYYDLIENLVSSFLENFIFDQFIKSTDFSKESFFKLETFYSRLSKVVDEIRNTNEYIKFTFLHYIQKTDRVQKLEEKIPVWLAEFILKFKGNLNCYSLKSEYKMFSPYISKHGLDESSNSIRFNVKIDNYRIIKSIPQNNCFLSNCEEVCMKLKEINHPEKISPFCDTFEI